MATEPTLIGNEETLGFSLLWEDNLPTSTSKAADATRGDLAVFVGGHRVWGRLSDGGCHGFTWSWVELLEHLAENWAPLIWHEFGPFGLGSPASLWRTEASQRWADLPSDAQAVEESVLWEYEVAHDLSSALQGAWPEPIWLLRRGNLYSIECRKRTVFAEATEVIDTLTTLGDAISVRLGLTTDPRAQAAMTAWAARHSENGPRKAAATITGIPEDTLLSLCNRAEDFATEWELENEIAPNELLAAARATQGIVSTEGMRAILKAVRAVRARPTPELDRISGAATKMASDHRSDRPYESGCRLAVWFRTHEQRQDDEDVNVERILGRLAVGLENVDLQTQLLDAVCCWGPRHGPAVLINASGEHASTEPGRRATLAHELCHLLVDRSSALPLAEVYGGHTYKDVEARANAFAAELLLPKHAAVKLARNATNADDYLRAAIGRYGVSREVAAWQLRNSGDMPENFRRGLSHHVSAPDVFIR